MRKELHLKVAESIEKVFTERLHEFYGMLAYHFSKGEDLEKAEEYMIKAGEVALSSSASREALRYYQEALSLYLSKYSETADPKRLAMLEKNIAIALYNKGEMEESLVYFDRVLKRWGIKPPKKKFFILTKLLFDLLMFARYLYFPSKKKGKVPTQRDIEIFDMSYKKDTALIALDPMRMFAEGVGTAKRILKFDFIKIENWTWVLICTSASFTALGLFRLGNKVLDFSEGFIDKTNTRELFPLECFSLGHSAMSGKWVDIKGLDHFLLEEGLKVGQLFNVSWHYVMYGWIKILQGKFNSAYPVIKKLSKISEEYEYRIAREYQLRGECGFFLGKRMLNDARKSVQKWELLFKSVSDNDKIMVLGWKAELQILLNDYDEAERFLNQAREIFRKQSSTLPIFAVFYLFPRFCLDMRLLEEAVRIDDKSDISKYRNKACKSGKKVLQNNKKTPIYRTDSFRERGLYYWLINKQNKAVKLWKKAIEEGKRLGARSELARTYMEIGKRFLEEKNKYKELNGISAKEYLEKARAMFQEMDLQWDLDELDKITSDV
jgi:tetratricopeptide (TPR) repeat protein